MEKKITFFILFYFHCTGLVAQFAENSKFLNIEHLHESVLLMGGGASFFDFNSDGFLDLYVTGGGSSDKLYRNLGNGKFYDVSEISLVSEFTINQQTSGVISGDINNDGFPDLFITTMDDTSNILLLNNQDGTFANSTATSGILEKSASMGSTFLDINNDGLLDIYVINYIKEPKFIRDGNEEIVGFDHVCFPNLLYINNGEASFTESAESYGVDNAGCGLAVVATDLNNDGNVDLYVANDFGEWVIPNTAYKNNYPSSNFENISVATKLDVELYAMGIAIGDYDNDLDNDLYITNLGRNNILKKDQFNNYEDLTSELGIENEFNEAGEHLTSWGTLFLDFDNDSDLDLFVSNGFVGSAPFLNTAKEDPNKFYRNDGNGTFVDISDEYFVAPSFYNRGAIYGDYDNDGDLDIFCVTADGSNNSESYSLFYENQLENKLNWLEVLLEGSVVNFDAYGALVTLYSNGSSFMRELYGGGSYASQSSNTLHFGLGSFDIIDSLNVRWNQNNNQVFYDIPVNEKIYLKENNNNFEIVGCTDEENTFFNSRATFNKGCLVEGLVGCTDENALNYNPKAIYNNGQCVYESIVAVENDQSFTSEIDVYPSIFSENLTIDVNFNERYSIYIYDVSGKIIFKENIQNKKSIVINTIGFLSGFYLVNVININKRQKSKTRKIIKI